MVRRRLGIGRHLLALVGHPLLFVESIRAGISFRAHRGLLPSSEYLAWRFHTAYGDAMSPVASEDTLAYLRWRRQMRRLR